MPNTNIAPLTPGVLHVLYTSSNLEEGDHTLRVQNNPLPNNRSGSRMSIAYSQVLSLSDGVSQSSGCVLPYASLGYLCELLISVSQRPSFEWTNVCTSQF